jgi:prolyl-tRNA synthetase
MFYKSADKVILALIRGDHQINENKIIEVAGLGDIERLDENEYSKLIGGKVGFAGPQNIREIASRNGYRIDLIIADNYLKGVVNGVSGANKDDMHTININYPRDYSVDIWADIKNATSGDRCVKCGSILKFTRGIEVGQIFKLGTKYSSKLDCYFVDEKQEKRPMEMGCYGIGVTRTVAAVIEQFNDEKGIIWPIQVAPFHVYLINIEADDNVIKKTEELYRYLLSQGIEVLWDDRNERAGVKFNDCDLIGIPYRIVVSKKTLLSDEFEVKKRTEKQPYRISFKDMNVFVMEIKSKLREG